MSDLDNQETPKQEQPETQATETPLTDIEQRAASKGWKPKNQFQGDETTFIDAGEFLRREPLFAKIAESSRRQKEMENVLRQTLEMNRKLAQDQRDKDLRELEAKRNEAINNADTQAFQAADAEYLKKKTEAIQMPQVPQASQFTPEEMQAFADFRARHGNVVNLTTPEGKRLATIADNLYTDIAAENPGRSAIEYLKLTETKLKALYPNKFGDVTGGQQAPAVAAPTRSATKADNLPAFSELNALQQEQCRIFERSGGTKKEYIEQLRKIGRI